MVCGSRRNGTYGTYYYNKCGLIQARYLQPKECILERDVHHEDCKLCGEYCWKVSPCLILVYLEAILRNIARQSHLFCFSAFNVIEEMNKANIQTE